MTAEPPRNDGHPEVQPPVGSTDPPAVQGGSDGPPATAGTAGLPTWLDLAHFQPSDPWTAIDGRPLRAALRENGSTLSTSSGNTRLPIAADPPAAHPVRIGAIGTTVTIALLALAVLAGAWSDVTGDDPSFLAHVAMAVPCLSALLTVAWIVRNREERREALADPVRQSFVTREHGHGAVDSAAPWPLYAAHVERSGAAEDVLIHLLRYRWADRSGAADVVFTTTTPVEPFDAVKATMQLVAAQAGALESAGVDRHRAADLAGLDADLAATDADTAVTLLRTSHLPRKGAGRR
jgi:hypothetical protein